MRSCIAGEITAPPPDARAALGGAAGQDLGVAVLRYLTHPESRGRSRSADPEVGTGGLGRALAEALLAQPWVGRARCRAARRRLELAAVLADHLGLAVEVRPDTGENDRSTGFVPPPSSRRSRTSSSPSRSDPVQGRSRPSARRRLVAGLADLLAPSSPGSPGRTRRRRRRGGGRPWRRRHALVLLADPSSRSTAVTTSRVRGATSPSTSPARPCSTRGCRSIGWGRPSPTVAGLRT